MNTPSLTVKRLAAMLLLVIALSGCALGERRLRSTPAPEQPQTQQSQPAAPNATPVEAQPVATLAATATDVVENNAPTAETAATVAAGDTQGDDLFQLINTLDAANQAGDALEDLP